MPDKIQFIARTHVVVVDEVQRLKAKGVSFRPEDDTELVNMINDHFTNFELGSFLNSVDDTLLPLVDKQFQVFRSVTIDDSPRLKIQLYSENYSDKVMGMAFARIFYKEQSELVVEHDFFRIPEAARGNGVARQIMAECLQQYINLGVKRIKVHAALTDGGYAWSKYHFTVPDKKEINLILADAKLSLLAEEFATVKRIYDNYYQKNPDGKAFPIVKWGEYEPMKGILRGSHWHGEIDFNNSEQLDNFITYVTA